MSAVIYREIGVHEIDCIRSLWEDLNTFHREKTPHFRLHYERMTFEERKEYFISLTRTGFLHTDIASIADSGMGVGYCVCSVSVEKNGSIESIFVHPAYRSKGIGTALVTRGLQWMDSCGAMQKRVSVAAGNEDALPFYAKSRFVPRMTVLEQIPES